MDTAAGLRGDAVSDKPIDAEVVPPPQALVVRASQDVAPPGLFGTQEPVAVIEKATAVATALKGVIVRQGLISKISGKEYPKCEAWTLLGTMLGVFPVLCWSRPVENGWEARVEARTRDGAVVGAAEAECLRSEKNWSNRDDFALRSMAQTRATAKCLRMPLGFVMTLAGYEATPAEEMVSDHPEKPARAPQAPAKPAPVSKPAPLQPRPPAAKETLPRPTPESRAKMITALKANPGEPNRDIVTEYFKKLTDPTPLMPNQELEELDLRFVPATTGQMKDLSEKITRFGNGDRAAHAFPPHYGPLEEPKAPEPAKPQPPKSVQKAQAKDPEWWKDVIVPIPHKGQRRDEYMKNPETIGSLYELRHGDDDEANEARQRLWGFVNHFEPKPFTMRDGTVRPPSDADKTFREALDDFAEWFEKNHPDEKL